MDENNNETYDRIHDVELKKTMETSYIDYAMSVIVSRALPDVRDGLKPVQRRILYSMTELSNTPDKPHRKCARIVGDTMGKYHPHGDSSIYGALVNMAQDWSTRYPLVDGHGNFGSVDGDGAAAMRYTEARLTKISMELLADIGKDTVDFMPNFDETEKEPTVLPARYPNLLVNGTTGIAVGMATNIPPHNLRETIAACVKMIDNRIEEDRDTSIDEIMNIIKGPDFPTGGVIMGRRGIEEAYRTGRGKIRVRGVTEIEEMPNGKHRIVITELPYEVNKAKLQEKIADLHKEKRIDGITALRDESNRQGMRVVVELRANVNPNVVLNQLYKHTQLQDTFGVNMLALVGSGSKMQPKLLNIHDVLMYYLKHQEDVVTRRTKFDLKKALDRAHIVEGLLIALDHIDEVIALIRASKNTQEAKDRLMDRFSLSDAQAQAIVDMRLRALTGLEREKLEQEYAELQKKIAELKAILADEKVLLGVIRTEMMAISDKYGDDRRTKFSSDSTELLDEDLIPQDDIVITLTGKDYIKRMSGDTFRTQNRGGRGIIGTTMLDDDYVKEIFMMSTHDHVLFFTNQGRVYRLKGYEIPEAGRTSRGTALINLLELQPGERISIVITIAEFSDDKYLTIGTKNGMIKKTPLSDYRNIMKNGLIAIDLRDGDELIEAKYTDGDQDIFMITKGGKCIRFHESEVRPMGRKTIGVRGIKLQPGDEVISMQLGIQGDCLLFVSQKGLGKCTRMDEFRPQGRGGMGVKCYKIVDKSGPLAGAMAVFKDNEIMMINSAGIIIRMNVSDVSVTGRDATGVKMISLEEGVTVAGFTKVKDSEAEVSRNRNQDLYDEIVDENDADEEPDDFDDSDKQE